VRTKIKHTYWPSIRFSQRSLFVLSCTLLRIRRTCATQLRLHNTWLAWERNVRGTKRPRNESSKERNVHGAKRPKSVFRSRERNVLGTKSPVTLPHFVRFHYRVTQCIVCSHKMQVQSLYAIEDCRSTIQGFDNPIMTVMWLGSSILTITLT